MRIKDLEAAACLLLHEIYVENDLPAFKETQEFLDNDSSATIHNYDIDGP